MKRPSDLRAGTAKTEIHLQEAGRAVHDSLFAKVLALEDGCQRLAIIAMDAVAIGAIADISDNFLPRLRARIKADLGVLHVLVNASHTHPANRLLCPEGELLERVLEAVKAAFRSLVPVRAGSGEGREDRILINRSLPLKNGTAWTIRQSIPCPPDNLVTDVGPIDPAIGLLRIDRMDGTPLAVVYNYACHTLIGVPSGAITGNFPAFASEVIEDNLPGTMALFLQGAAGDITELLYKDVNRPRDARPLGMMLGLSALKVLRTIDTGTAELRVLNEALEFPRRTDGEERIAALEIRLGALTASLRFTSLNFKSFLPLYIKHLFDSEHPSDYSYRYLQEAKIGVSDLLHLDAANAKNLSKYLENIQSMEEMAKLVDDVETLKRHLAENRDAGGLPIKTEILGVRIGDFFLITSATEVATSVATKIKQLSPHRKTYISAFTNGYLHYGSAAADYEKGGYEVTECLLAPEWEAIFQERALAILEKLGDL